MPLNENQNIQDSRSDEISEDDTSVAIYEVVVQTGDHNHAATQFDSAVKINIIGNKGETKLKRLSHILKRNFEKGQKDTFKIGVRGKNVHNTPH